MNRVLVYSDEFQDMKLNRVELLSLICDTRFNINMRIYGDILQTIYAHSIKNTSKHPILEWCYKTNAVMFNTDVCFRCPPSHLNLLSCIFNQSIYGGETVYNKYNVLEIKPSKEEITPNEKPIMLFIDEANKATATQLRTLSIFLYYQSYKIIT